MFSVVDIFAGPGGLSEGFSSFSVESGRGRKRPFSIAVSAEKDAAAHSTLRLRSFFRQFGDISDVPQSYYDFLAGRCELPYSAETQKEWAIACEEALQLTLGVAADNAKLHEAILKRIPQSKPWILIGGPPCQAYSVVGRARNKGKDHYQPEKDHRHFLYREYLHILDAHEPDAFIMENVRGILSSKIHGESIFQQILTDLKNPSHALGKKKGARYVIVPLGIDWHEGDEPEPDDYLLFSENHGVPQTRHRVILLGIRADHAPKSTKRVLDSPKRSVKDAWIGLPKLRSGLSGGQDSGSAWLAVVESEREKLLNWLSCREDLTEIGDFLKGVEFGSGLTRGGLRIGKSGRSERHMPLDLSQHLLDERLDVVLNHEARGHMRYDLRRYMFCAAFAHCNKGRSPRSEEFLAQLAPKHASWKSGGFSDRFKVHAASLPSRTITSHIAKDGHYFIHHDSSQCRSMTVREAARLQTFPDNYFFLGNRTEQFTQVGNAVPPLLAKTIASVVYNIFYN